jgi:tRNA threonylcarbamoyladenosine biosynthesis protein TsaB
MSVVVGFDTATPVTTAALLRPDGSAVEAHDEPPAESRGRHASLLLGLVERVLRDGGASWADVSRLAVGVGPGGFTGLRIGIATARALAQARGLEVVPVSSLEALAAGALAARPASAAGEPASGATPAAGERASGATPAAGERASGATPAVAEPASGATRAAAEPAFLATPAGPVAAVIDARRGEVFAAIFAPDGSPLFAPAALAPEALAERLAALPATPLAVGDGAVRFAEELASAGAVVPPADTSVHRLDAVQICRLGQVREPVDRDALLPTYLREPDAKPSVIT